MLQEVNFKAILLGRAGFEHGIENYHQLEEIIFAGKPQDGQILHPTVMVKRLGQPGIVPNHPIPRRANSSLKLPCALFIRVVRVNAP
jgi:hypothetical protein